MQSSVKYFALIRLVHLNFFSTDYTSIKCVNRHTQVQEEEGFVFVFFTTKHLFLIKVKESQRTSSVPLCGNILSHSYIFIILYYHYRI